jgi:hypothetical protein
MITGARGIASFILGCGGSSPHAKTGGTSSSVVQEMVLICAAE